MAPPKNALFAIIGANQGMNCIKLRFPDDGICKISLDPLEILHFKGSEYISTIVETESDGDITVFSGRNCTRESIGSCSHLLEHMNSVINYFSANFFFINLGRFQPQLDSALIEPLLPISCNLVIGNANASAAELRISGQNSIKLDE